MYRNKIKNISGIVGVFLSIIGFGFYYLYASKYYSDVTNYSAYLKFISNNINWLGYYSMFVGLGLLCLSLGMESEKRIKYLIYYTGTGFWFTLFIMYIFNDFGLIFGKFLPFCFLFWTAIICLILYLLHKNGE